MEQLPPPIGSSTLIGRCFWCGLFYPLRSATAFTRDYNIKRSRGFAAHNVFDGTSDSCPETVLKRAGATGSVANYGRGIVEASQISRTRSAFNTCRRHNADFGIGRNNAPSVVTRRINDNVSNRNQGGGDTIFWEIAVGEGGRSMFIVIVKYSLGVVILEQDGILDIFREEYVVGTKVGI